MSDESQNQLSASESSPPPPTPESESQPRLQLARPHTNRTPAIAATIGVAGWIVPGLGHALQKMWGRALACFFAVGVLVVIGSGMRGNLFQSADADAFGRLGYIADVGTGSFYWLASGSKSKDPTCRMLTATTERGFSPPQGS